MGKVNIAKFEKKLASCKKIGLDSMVFIYQFSNHPQYSQLTSKVIEYLEKDKLKAVTSYITVIETLVKPGEEKDDFLIFEYEKVFQNLPNLEIVAIDWPVARLTAKLRSIYKKIKIPDALQIAVTLLKGYRFFLTNDEKLKKIKELEVIILKDFLV